MLVRGLSQLPAYAGSCVSFVALAALAVACGGGKSSSSIDPAGAGTGGAIDVSITSPGGGTENPSPGATSVWPPAGFTNVTATNLGAYGLGPRVNIDSDGGTSTDMTVTTGSSASGCGALFAVVRDFKMGDKPGGHPDFQTHLGDDRGIVSDALGGDGKPVYAAGPRGTNTTSGAANFDQWYRDVPDVNQTYVLGLHLVQNGSVISFQADQFFPLDNAGFGNESQPHNFSFTTEIKTSFAYNGGETFTFIGDDDVFVFINHQLVINMGGVHTAETGKVSIDQLSARLGLVKGQVYDLAVFHAERHTSESHFRIDSTLTLVDCGQLPPGVTVN